MYHKTVCFVKHLLLFYFYFFQAFFSFIKNSKKNKTVSKPTAFLPEHQKE